MKCSPSAAAPSLQIQSLLWDGFSVFEAWPVQNKKKSLIIKKHRDVNYSKPGWLAHCWSDCWWSNHTNISINSALFICLWWKHSSHVDREAQSPAPDLQKIAFFLSTLPLSLSPQRLWAAYRKIPFTVYIFLLNLLSLKATVCSGRITSRGHWLHL